ncbi:hypothetical protein [Roseateles sp.]|uniref:hypothetical protein n=1 Tax=Roseateles sp. TaxID=1971397 RepID=UPI0025DA52AA|nr:hypothetical protein [Roseateles sp.]MBV8037534.1 hypothetical protein [Roseateles sp.]
MSTPDFFRARLDAMVDPKHPLVVLASRLPWAQVTSRRFERPHALAVGGGWILQG